MSLLKKNESIEMSRRRQRFNSHDTNYSSANSSRIRINIDVSEEHIDFENSYLSFDISVAEGSTTGDLGLPRFISSCWIREIRIKDRAGNQIGENLQDYYVYARHILEMGTQNEQQNSYLDALEGALGDAVATRSSISATGYIHRVLTHIPAMKNYYPAKYLGGIQIEIDMVQASEVALQNSGNAGSVAVYTISNLAYVCDLIKLKPEVEGAIQNALQSGGLTVDYVSAHTIKGTITAGLSNKRFDLGTMNGRVKNMFAIQVTAQANESVDTYDSFRKNSLTSYRFRLGSRYMSESQIDTSGNRNAEYLMEYLKATKLSNEPYGLYGNSTTLTKADLVSTNVTSKFIIGQGADRSKTDEVLSSLKDKDNNRLELELNFTSSNASTLYVFVHLDKRQRIMPGKQFIDDDFSGQGTIMAT